MRKTLTLGMLAHVDAGKTTTIEAMLYEAGKIRRPGRVDSGSTVMDYDEEEKAHGITIYAKETHLSWKNIDLDILDTPGHVDFSSEMERVLEVLDAALVIINGQKGVESHTETIWKELKKAGVPVLLFVNKMDISQLSKEALMKNLSALFGSNLVAMEGEDLDERLAMVSEAAMNDYLQKGRLSPALVQEAFWQRKWIPVCFGSALKDQGVCAVLDLLEKLGYVRTFPEAFGARVYKVSMAPDGTRLCHVKVTGGALTPRMALSPQEKVDQIRLYSGADYTQTRELRAGHIGVLTGLKNVHAGDGLGFESGRSGHVSEAGMVYELAVPEGANVLELADTCRRLGEEDPSLLINLEEDNRIRLALRGAMQKEVIQKTIFARTGIKVQFVHGTILYKETIAGPVYGVGHFEPLRHYAEVQLRLDPRPPGSGILVISTCSTDVCQAGDQKAVLEALKRRQHRGVLTGSLLTDVQITLLYARGSLKHTQGGDFRQAACRAVRQALMKAENVLLEPFDHFHLIVDKDSLSLALYDLNERKAQVEVQERSDGRMEIIGEGPQRYLANYQQEVTAYSHGRGLYQAESAGWKVSPDPASVIRERGYDPQADPYNSSDSIFCAHGAGFTVPWNEVEQHTDPCWLKGSGTAAAHRTQRIDEAEVQRVFAMVSGRNQKPEKKLKARTEEEKKKKPVPADNRPGCLVVDGYNLLFARQKEAELTPGVLSLERDRLVADLAAYQAYCGSTLVVVFDGYRVKENPGTIVRRHDMIIIYTRTDETADAWIAAHVKALAERYRLTVATSDALVQTEAFAHGALRMSARELLAAMAAVPREASL
jgi:ribosomal protection tetracycline resistance protein